MGTALDSNDANPFDEIERMGTAFGLLAIKEFGSSLSDLIATAASLAPVFRWHDDRPCHWTFNPPEEPRPRPVSGFAPRCRPAARPWQRARTVPRNRARSRPGGKRAARRAA